MREKEFMENLGTVVDTTERWRTPLNGGEQHWTVANSTERWRTQLNGGEQH